jgi:hypothetical protein
MTKETWREIIIDGAYSQEFDWFASDRNGNLGIFSAIMNAPIPESIKVSYENYIKVEEIISSLPKSTSHILTTNENGNFSDWISYAEKGLFAFDFQDVHRTKNEIKNQYDLIAKPFQPILVNDKHILFDIIIKLDCDFSCGDLKITDLKDLINDQ